MKTAVLFAAAAVGLSACAPPYVHRADQRLKPISRLDCPDSQGDLTRASQSSDGTSCGYTSTGGASVQLKLTPVSGNPEAVVLPLEAQLKTELPPPPPPPTAPPASSTPADDHDKVDINLPGVSIHADNQGARIRAPGVHIDADDQHAQVHVAGQAPNQVFGPPERGQVTVDANDNGAVIHALSFGPNFQEDLILVSKAPGPQGWRTVGYEALGPRSGPLVLATVRSKSDEHDELFNEVRALVRRAAGG